MVKIAIFGFRRGLLVTIVNVQDVWFDGDMAVCGLCCDFAPCLKERTLPYQYSMPKSRK